MVKDANGQLLREGDRGGRRVFERLLNVEDYREENINEFGHSRYPC